MVEGWNHKSAPGPEGDGDRMESGLSSADPGFRITIRFMGENWILVTKLGTPSFS